MRVVLSSIGSFGDVMAFLVLADELRKRGHTCVFALPDHLVEPASQRGYRVVELSSPDLTKAYLADVLEFERGEAGPAGEAYMVALTQAARPALKVLRGLADETDVLISSVAMPLSRVVHDITGIPYVGVRTQHLGEPLPTLPVVNEIRVEHDLEPIRDGDEAGLSPMLNLLGISPVILDAGVPPGLRAIGFLLPTEEAEPSPEVRAFVDANPGAIAVTMGSTMYEDAHAYTRMLVEAVHMVDRAAIVQSGWAGLGEGLGGRSASSRTLVTGFVPHQWLFPRVACVVHQAGGSLGSILRAGVPGVAIPNHPTAGLWAESLERTGTTVVVLYSKLTAATLADALRSVLENASYCDRAETVRLAMSADGGAQLAVDLITELVRTAAPSQ